MAIEDLSTTTIFMMIFGLVRARARAGTARGDAAPRGGDSGRPAQVLLSFGGGALAAYIYDEDRKKDK